MHFDRGSSLLHMYTEAKLWGPKCNFNNKLLKIKQRLETGDWKQEQEAGQETFNPRQRHGRTDTWIQTLWMMLK